jgi:hypothetical protein
VYPCYYYYYPERKKQHHTTLSLSLSLECSVCLFGTFEDEKEKKKQKKKNSRM